MWQKVFRGLVFHCESQSELSCGICMSVFYNGTSPLHPRQPDDLCRMFLSTATARVLWNMYVSNLLGPLPYTQCSWTISVGYVCEHFTGTSPLHSRQLDDSCGKCSLALYNGTSPLHPRQVDDLCGICPWDTIMGPLPYTQGNWTIYMEYTCEL